MSIELLDYATLKPDGRPAAWSDFQAEYECNVPVSSGFVVLPAGRGAPARGPANGKFTCKQAHSALGYNSLRWRRSRNPPPPAGSHPGSAGSTRSRSSSRPGGGHPEGGGSRRSGTSSGHSRRSAAPPSHSTSAPSAPRTRRPGQGRCHPRPRRQRPSVVDGFQRHYFWHDLVADQLTDLVLDVRWHWDPALGGLAAYRRAAASTRSFRRPSRTTGPPCNV